jgi:hypothetical protein
MEFVLLYSNRGPTKLTKVEHHPEKYYCMTYDQLNASYASLVTTAAPKFIGRTVASLKCFPFRSDLPQ